MAKTRMLKSDLRTSEKVASWPIELRYFWVLLWGYVDDHGKARDNAKLIKADCFPLDEEITPEVVDAWLWQLHGDGSIIRYTVDGRDYLRIKNWKRHQKPPHPTGDTLPSEEAPGATRRVLHEDFMNDAGSSPRNAGSAHEDFTPGLGWVESGLSGGDAKASKEPPLFCSAHPGGTAQPCRACGDARRVHDAWVKTKPAFTLTAVSAVMLPPRKEDYCKRHDWLLAKGCAECAEEKRASA